jgi:hypothetical protein
MIKIKTNLKSIERVVAAYGKEIRKATMRTINRTAPQAKSEFNRQIKKIYNYPLKRLKDKKKVKLSKASMSRLQADLSVSGKPQSIIEFTQAAGVSGFRQARAKAYDATTRRAATGVKVKVYKQGGTLTIRRAFISPGRFSSKPLVYWRVKGTSYANNYGKYKGRRQDGITGKRFRGTSGLVSRYPIEALYSVSIPQMFNNPIVTKNTNRYYASQFEKNYDNVIQRLMYNQDRKVKKAS